MKTKRALATLVLGMLLQACVYVPLPSEKEYSEEKLAQLELGITTRQQVYELLGTPHIVDPHGPGVLFSDVRTIAFVATAWGSDTAKVNDSLYVEFDDQDVLGHVELFDFNETKICISNGLCMIRNPITHAVNWVVFVRPPAEDRTAKEFSPLDDACSVYLFAETSIGKGIPQKAWHRVLLDAEYVGVLHSPENYIHLALSPGEHEITIPQAVMWGEWNGARGCIMCQPGEGMEKEPASLDIDCNAGGMHFLKLTERTETKGMFTVYYNPVELRLEFMPEETARPNILQRALVSSAPVVEKN